MAVGSMSNDLWRWADPDGQQRKVRLEELRAALAEGRIASNAPVWRSGWGKWQPAHEVPELTSASSGAANGVVLNIPPPPLAMVAVQTQYEKSSESMAPVPSSVKLPVADEEPPPPPPYIPVQRKSLGQQAPLKTQLGGSAHVPASAIPSTPPAPLAAPSPRPATAKLGPSLPTAIGVPPPPELVAKAQGALGPKPPPQTQGATRPGAASGPTAKSSASAALPTLLGGTAGALAPAVAPAATTAPGAPAPPPSPAPPARAPSESIEELSDSMLVDSNSNPELPAAPLPPIPADDTVAQAPVFPYGGEPGAGYGGDPMPSDELSDEVLPKKIGLEQILADLAEIRNGRPPKNKLVIAVLGVILFSMMIMLIAGIVSIFSGPSTEAKTKPSPSGTPSASGTIAGTTTTAAAAVTAPAEAPRGALGDCAPTGESKSIAPRAVIASAIEAHALGGGLALGFAAAPRDAVATALDPASLAPTSTVRTKAAGDARRVTPMLVNGRLTALPDVDRKGDHIGNRRIVPLNTLVDVGFTDKGLVWAPHGRDTSTTLFALDGDATGEALRAVPLADKKGFAVTFRRGNAIHIGVARGTTTFDADGALAKVNGLGQVGSPAITTSGDKVIVAWADRAGADDSWKIRWTQMKIGGAAAEPSTFNPPEGGLGGQAMAPSLAGLGGGRFLLSWTEGPVSNHQVRAITMNADGSPASAAVAISATGVNAGQPAAVVASDGRGAVAFIAAKGKALEVHATPISCPPR
jgi:hypothetical protein